MTVSRVVRMGLFVFVIGLLAVPVSAQFGAQGRGPGGRKQPGVKEPPPERFSASGTVEAVIRGKIKIKSTTDQVWIINVTKGTEVVVKGEADPETLTRNMWIRATMGIDRKGRTHKPVAALTVISRREDTVVGVFPTQAAGGFDEPAADPKAAQDPNATTDYDVVGMLTGMKKGKYTVKTLAGNKQVDVEFEMTEDAKVDVSVDDYSLAKPGDEITVSGTIVRQAPGPVNPGEITGIGNATAVEIQLKEKIASQTKGKRVRKPASNRTSGRARGEESAGKKKEGEATKEGEAKSDGDEKDK